MANFNTYQTRNLYVVKDFLASGEPDSAGELAMGTAKDNGEIFFKYFNGDEQLTRTDLIRPESIISLKKTKAAEMDIPLQALALTVDTDAADFVTSNALVDKTFTLTINLHQVMSYDMNDFYPVTVSLVGTSTNTASVSAFLNALAGEIVKNMPKFTKKAPYKVYLVKSGTATEAVAANNSVSSATGIVIVPAPGDYRRGIMSKEVFDLTFTSRLHDDDVAWAKEMVDSGSLPLHTVAAVNSYLGTSIAPAAIPSVYTIADLEHFALGERGDQFRGYWYPHNYEPTYLVDLTKSYDIVSVEFAWQGNAENIQKSPRMIQFACEVSGSGSQATSDADDLYDAIAAAMAGVSESASAVGTVAFPSITPGLG
jgi:hypothetical protein